MSGPDILFPILMVLVIFGLTPKFKKYYQAYLKKSGLLERGFVGNNSNNSRYLFNSKSDALRSRFYISCREMVYFCRS